MSDKTAFHQALADLTAQLAGKPLDAALAQWLNTAHGPTSTTYQRLREACIQGAREGWLCEREGGGIRYGRVFKPEDALHRFSVDVVDMQNIAGPHHTHPQGEIDLIVPLEGVRCLTATLPDGAFTRPAVPTTPRWLTAERWCCTCCPRGRSSSPASAGACAASPWTFLL